MLATDMSFDRPTASRLDTRMPAHVRIINGALDDDPMSPGGIILVGRIDPSTFRFLKVDDNYQRSLSDRSDIYEAIKSGTVPPTIDIGVRGQDFVSDGADYIIKSPAFIIDGWQRLGTAQRILEMIPDLPVRIFAMVHFGTTEAWERERFDNLNKNVRKVSSDHHLRNMKDRNPAVLTLFGLCHNSREFPLFKKVCWSQNMQRGELLKAMVLAKTCRVLHAHIGKMGTLSADGVAETLMHSASVLSLAAFRANIQTFFSIVNDCWPLSMIEYRHAAPQLKSTFLSELARMFSDHPMFWDERGHVLALCADDRRKLAKFPINDPRVVNLAGSGGKAKIMLYQLLVNHMDSGRRTNRMVKR